MVLISDESLVGCFPATLFFSSFQKFLIRLRSGLFPSHSNNFIFFVLRKSVTIFARWDGAPSCINISQLCTAMCNSNFTFVNSRYFWHSWWFRDRGRTGRPFLGLKSLSKSSHSAGVSWFAVWIFHCTEFLVVSSQFSSSRQTAELLFRREAKLWTIAGFSSLCFFRKLQALQLHRWGQSRTSSRFPWFEAKFVG